MPCGRLTALVTPVSRVVHSGIPRFDSTTNLNSHTTSSHTPRSYRKRPSSRPVRLNWAEPLKRVFDLDLGQSRTAAVC